MQVDMVAWRLGLYDDVASLLTGLLSSSWGGRFYLLRVTRSLTGLLSSSWRGSFYLLRVTRYFLEAHDCALGGMIE